MKCEFEAIPCEFKKDKDGVGYFMTLIPMTSTHEFPINNETECLIPISNKMVRKISKIKKLSMLKITIETIP